MDESDVPAAPQPPATTSGFSNKTLMIIGMVVVVVVILIAAAAYYYYFKFTSPTAPMQAANIRGEGEYKRDSSKKQEFSVKNQKIMLTSGDEIEKVLTNASEEHPVVLFYGHPGCHHCSACVGAFEAAAGEKAGESVFVVDGSKVGSKTIESFGVDAFPSIYKYTSSGKKVEYSGDRSKSSFKKFID